MFQATGSVQIKASAKVNLYLEVIGARPDGYHDIRSVVVPTSICDGLVLKATGGVIETLVTHNGCPGTEVVGQLSQDKLLTNRAARALRDLTGYKGGVQIMLDKHIPVGGGMGGGSADAAAVLGALNELWRTDVPKPELMKLGVTLGCDVAALLHGGAVSVEGAGERVAPIQRADANGAGSWWLLIANPNVAVSTRDIYERWNPPLTSPAQEFTKMVSAVREGSFDAAVSNLRNDLQEAAYRKYPLIRILAETLESAGAEGVLMSGSGASVFCLSRSAEEAERWAVVCRQKIEFPVWCKVAQVLPDGVMVAHGPLEA